MTWVFVAKLVHCTGHRLVQLWMVAKSISHHLRNPIFLPQRKYQETLWYGFIPMVSFRGAKWMLRPSTVTRTWPERATVPSAHPNGFEGISK